MALLLLMLRGDHESFSVKTLAEGVEMKQILRFFVAAGMVLSLASAASAITYGVIPGKEKNDFIGTLFTGPQIGGYYGASLYLISSGAVDVQIDFLGAEAGYKNQFNFNNAQLFAHNGGKQIASNLSTPLATTTLQVNPGLLNFSFDYNNDAGSVLNGANPDDSTGTVGPNFFLTFNPFALSPQPMSGQVVYLFLDDGGANNDDNHDDFLVRLTVTNGKFSVPEPTTLLLLGLGLAGLAATRKRIQ